MEGHYCRVPKRIVRHVWDLPCPGEPRHAQTSLISLGMGHIRNSSLSPNIHLQAAFAATRPKTTQSRRELPPKRLFPWTPPATSPAAYSPGITSSFESYTAELTS